MSTQEISRREIIAGLGGAGALGMGALAVLPSGAAAQLGLSFEDETATVGPEEEVADLVIDGTVEGEYQASEADVSAVRFVIQLEGGPAVGDTSLQETVDAADVDPTGGTVSEDISFSLVEETDLEPEDITPDGGDGSSVDYDWTVTVTMIVMAGQQQVARDRKSAEATYTVERDGGNGGGGGSGGDGGGSNPSASLGGSLSLQAETA